MPLSPLGIAINQTQTQPAASRPGTIAPTDVLGAYKMATDQANAQYLAKLQQQNSLWGGLAGLGGSALTAGILKGNLFSPAAAAAAPTATTAAAPVATSFAPFASGAPAVAGSDFAGVPLAGLDVPAAGAAGTAALDAGGTAALDAGTAAATDAAAAAAPAVADAGATTLADLLPFLFAV